MMKVELTEKNLYNEMLEMVIRASLKKEYLRVALKDAAPEYKNDGEARDDIEEHFPGVRIESDEAGEEFLRIPVPPKERQVINLCLIRVHENYGGPEEGGQWPSTEEVLESEYVIVDFHQDWWEESVPCRPGLAFPNKPLEKYSPPRWDIIPEEEVQQRLDGKIPRGLAHSEYLFMKRKAKEWFEEYEGIAGLNTEHRHTHSRKIDLRVQAQVGQYEPDQEIPRYE
ncbi:MAG: hypothetical protein JRH07_10585 [Deltaproteobacteria bacterium]|nr:hypothetical protein [Deltaproteobacteria bacterium]